MGNHTEMCGKYQQKLGKELNRHRPCIHDLTVSASVWRKKQVLLVGQYEMTTTSLLEDKKVEAENKIMSNSCDHEVTKKLLFLIRTH